MECCSGEGEGEGEGEESRSKLLMRAISGVCVCQVDVMHLSHGAPRRNELLSSAIPGGRNTYRAWKRNHSGGRSLGGIAV